MDRNEAKLVLQACRSDGRDAQIPAFAEALRLVEQDPELRAWWEAQQAFDRKVTAKLKDVPLPPNLRATILAGHKLEGQRSRLRLPHWLAIAAMVAILAVAGSIWQGTPNGKPLAANEYVASVLPLLHNDAPHLGMESGDPSKLKAWLKERNSPMGDMPAPMAALPGVGCQTYAVRGHAVSLICFAMKDGRIAHLFVIAKDALKNPPPDGVPQFGTNGAWATAAWSDAGHSYVLATQDSPEALKQLL